MKLEEYLRTILNNKLIPLVRKDQCEICNSIKNLEVHHMKLFKDILEETLQELKLEYKSKEKYSPEEINLIVNVVLGKHLNIEYMTLYKNCHTLTHEETWKNVCINDKHKQYYEKLKLIKDIQEKQYIENIVIPYLNTILGKKLYKEERQMLINKINLKQNGKLIKDYKFINIYLQENNINYIITSKKDNRKILKDGTKNQNRGNHYWQINL